MPGVRMWVWKIMTTNSDYVPAKGDIVWLVLDPRVGHEQSGRRPVIVISEKLFAERTCLAVICPINTKVKGLPFEIVLKNSMTKGAVLPIHIKSVDWKARHAKYIETVKPAMLRKITEAVEAIIGLSSN